jgi:hypothetical protein
LLLRTFYPFIGRMMTIRGIRQINTLLGVERAWADSVIKTNDLRNCVTNTGVVRVGDARMTLLMILKMTECM